MTRSNETTMLAERVPSHGLARQDWNSARFVEEGITIQVVYGMRDAAAFLKSRMIEIDVAKRVLLSPTLRRNYTLA